MRMWNKPQTRNSQITSGNDKSDQTPNNTVQNNHNSTSPFETKGQQIVLNPTICPSVLNCTDTTTLVATNAPCSDPVTNAVMTPLLFEQQEATLKLHLSNRYPVYISTHKCTSALNLHSTWWRRAGQKQRHVYLVVTWERPFIRTASGLLLTRRRSEGTCWKVLRRVSLDSDFKALLSQVLMDGRTRE